MRQVALLTLVRQSSGTGVSGICTIMGLICTFMGMEIKNLYEPFSLELRETDHYIAREHRKTFFEMVFILNGKGVQIINQHKLPYSPNKLFLIFPQDSHGFEVQELTTFFFIRFNDIYLRTQGREWIRKMEYIFHNHNHLPGCILKNVPDKSLVRSLVEALSREVANKNPNQDEVVTQLINTIITLAARNITLPDSFTDSSPSMPTSMALVTYIQEHIYQPETLKADRIADHFHVAPSYISEYFRNHAGESLQQYIINYKLELIKTRLRYTDMAIHEIADEFGFTDQSHLSRIFKKYTHQSPSAYRKQRDAGE